MRVRAIYFNRRYLYALLQSMHTGCRNLCVSLPTLSYIIIHNERFLSNNKKKIEEKRKKKKLVKRYRNPTHAYIHTYISCKYNIDSNMSIYIRRYYVCILRTYIIHTRVLLFINIYKINN